MVLAFFEDEVRAARVLIDGAVALLLVGFISFVATLYATA
jgi:hypothetical protein